jgi:hypothetical protein
VHHTYGSLPDAAIWWCLRTGRHWIGGGRGGKGGAMRVYQKWFWRDSIFSCDRLIKKDEKLSLLL